MRAALGLLLLLAAPTVTVDVKEWPVPFKGHPRDPFPDAAGRIWFVGQEGHYLGRFDPKTGKFDKTPLDDGAGPHNLVIDGAGHVWFSGNLKGYIGELDPASGRIKRYPMPNPAARDPHTLVFDRDGRLWFTVQFGNFVGRLEPKTGEVRLVAMPTPGARPYGIVLDSKGRPFFNEFGTSKIGSPQPNVLVGFDPKTGAFFARAPFPSGAGTVRNMVFDRGTRQIWFGTDHDTIGRAMVP